MRNSFKSKCQTARRACDRQAIFFSLLRIVFIVVPLTDLMPYAPGMGSDGVFPAEPVSSEIGGSLCFITTLCPILPELKHMDRLPSDSSSHKINPELL